MFEIKPKTKERFYKDYLHHTSERSEELNYLIFDSGIKSKMIEGSVIDLAYQFYCLGFEDGKNTTEYQRQMCGK